MLGSVLVAIGALGATLTVLDLLLSRRRKEQIALLTQRWWSWLDDRKRLSALARLWDERYERAFIVLCVASLMAIYATLAVLYGHELRGKPWRDVLAIIAVGPFVLFLWIYFGRQVVRDFASSWRLLLVVGFVPVFIGAIVYVYFLVPQPSEPEGMVVWAAVLFIFGAPIAFIYLLVLGSYVLVHVARGLLHAAETVMRQIAEHEKGPLIAASILITAVGAILKLFVDRQ